MSGPIILVFTGLALLSLSSCAAPLNYIRTDGPRYTGCEENTSVDWSPRTGAIRPGKGRWPAAPEPSGEFRVASFNIQFSKRIEEAVGLIRENPALAEADVLLLQEMDERGVRRIAGEFGYCWVYYPATVHPLTQRRFGNAILSRYPFLGDHKVLLPHLGRFGKTLRIAAGATLDVHGTAVRVYSLHLATLMELGPEARRDQARAVVADAAGFEGPVLVGGDLNEHDLGNVFTEAGYTWVTEDIGKTTELASLDHFLTRGLETAPGVFTGKISDPEGASDHVPIWARFSIPSAGPSPLDALESADAVFQGTVIAVSFTPNKPDSTGRDEGSGLSLLTRYRLLVERVWKGNLPDTVDVFSSLGSDGFEFLAGLEYLVYAESSGTGYPFLVTGASMRTRHVSEADEDLKKLPTPKESVPERSRILIRKMDGRDNASHESVPGDAVETALYGLFSRWMASPPDPLPFDSVHLATLEDVIGSLESDILAGAGDYEPENRLSRARAASPEPIGLEEPIRVVDVTRAWNGGSALVVLEGKNGRRLTVIKRAGVGNSD